MPDRESVPLPFRVYALETTTSTQDEAIAQHSVTIARSDERLDAHDVMLATHTEQIGGLVKTSAQLGERFDRLINALYVFALTVAVAAIGSGVTIALTHP